MDQQTRKYALQNISRELAAGYLWKEFFENDAEVDQAIRVYNDLLYYAYPKITPSGKNPFDRAEGLAAMGFCVRTIEAWVFQDKWALMFCGEHFISTEDWHNVFHD